MASLLLAVIKRSQPDIILAEHIIKSPYSIIKSSAPAIKSPYGIIKSSAPVIKSPYGIIKSSASAIKSSDGIIKSPYSIIKSSAAAIMSSFPFIKLTECIITTAALIIMSCFSTIMHPYIIILSGSFIILSDSEAIIFSIAIIISTYTCTKDDKTCIMSATQSGRLVRSVKSDPKYTAIQITRSIIKFINTLISEKINLTNNSTGYTVFNFSNHCCRISYKSLPGKFRAVIEKYELATNKKQII